MSKRNYDQMYNNRFEEKKNEEKIMEPVAEVEEKEEKVEPVADRVREEVKKESPKARKTYKGRVIGGRRLNVRKVPNCDVIDSLADGETITILDDTDPEWFKIAAPEGFVKKEFVKVI